MSTSAQASIQLNARYNSISQERKDLVFGYIRQIQALCPKHIAYYNIPNEIKRLCVLYNVNDVYYKFMLYCANK